MDRYIKTAPRRGGLNLVRGYFAVVNSANLATHANCTSKSGTHK
jgi:hypothetical protein